MQVFITNKFAFAGNYNARLKESQRGLQDALQAWEEFDILHDTLQKWLKDTEETVKEHELKSTLDDKKNQLEKFKVRNFELVQSKSLLRLSLFLLITSQFITVEFLRTNSG